MRRTRFYTHTEQPPVKLQFCYFNVYVFGQTRRIQKVLKCVVASIPRMWSALSCRRFTNACTLLRSQNTVFVVATALAACGLVRDTCRHAFHTAGVILLLLLLMSMGRDCVSELRPPTGLLFVHQVICEHGEPRWNDTDRGQEKTYFLCHLTHRYSSKNPLYTL
jgi:hypothetical protein